jgi:amino acid transporter
VRTAVFVSLGVIAVVYAGVSFAMAVHYGDAQVVAAATAAGPETLFGMAGGALAEAGRVLFLTSLFAAMLAFHSFVTRYMYALGREGVLPRALERTGASGAPRTASLWQSGIGAAVILLYAVMGWDPLVKLFFWLGTSGAFGILALIAASSLAVVGFFLRAPLGETVWRRLLAPGVAALVLLAMVWLAVRNYATLLGVAPGAPAATWFPVLFAVVAACGVGGGLLLKVRNPGVYAAIGLGADAAAANRPDPQQRAHGAHALAERQRHQRLGRDREL